MKSLRINKPFQDKITGELYEPGTVRDFVDERAKAILADPRHLASLEKAIKRPTKKTRQ